MANTDTVEKLEGGPSYQNFVDLPFKQMSKILKYNQLSVLTFKSEYTKLKKLFGQDLTIFIYGPGKL